MMLSYMPNTNASMESSYNLIKISILILIGLTHIFYGSKLKKYRSKMSHGTKLDACCVRIRLHVILILSVVLCGLFFLSPVISLYFPLLEMA